MSVETRNVFKCICSADASQGISTDNESGICNNWQKFDLFRSATLLFERAQTGCFTRDLYSGREGKARRYRLSQQWRKCFWASRAYHPVVLSGFSWRHLVFKNHTLFGKWFKSSFVLHPLIGRYSIQCTSLFQWRLQRGCRRQKFS